MGSTPNPNSSFLSTIFSHGFLSMAGMIIGFLAGPIGAHLIPSSLSWIVVGLAAAWKAYNDEQSKNTTAAHVEIAANAATSAAIAAQSASDTAAKLETNAAIARAREQRAASPLQGGAPK
jgi:cation transport regulator ChaB